MRIDILTLFPGMFKGPFDESIVKRAQDKGLIEIKIHNLRSWAIDKRKTVDDRPYGGGSGMILRVDVIDSALQNLKSRLPKPGSGGQKSKVILLDARGEKFTQKRALQLSKLDHIILIAGHYEGVDHRVYDYLADYTISIGDYILTGGELPAMVIVDSITRLIPGALGNPKSLSEESFSELPVRRSPGGGGENGKCPPEADPPLEEKMENEAEYPQYTRPEEYRGWKVPKVLLSGNHQEIEKWRKKHLNH